MTPSIWSSSQDQLEHSAVVDTQVLGELFDRHQAIFHLPNSIRIAESVDMHKSSR
jgi:hypothetical protein